MTQAPDTEKVPGHNKAARVTAALLFKRTRLIVRLLDRYPVDRHCHLVFHARAADVPAPAFHDLASVRLLFGPMDLPGLFGFCCVSMMPCLLLTNCCARRTSRLDLSIKSASRAIWTGNKQSGWRMVV